MFKKVDVIFFVEHKDRELDSYKEVAKILKEKYNISSLIISNFFHSYLLWIYRPKLIVWNNLTDNKGWPDGFIWNLYKNDLVYVSHRWEQRLNPINEEFKAPKTEFEKNKVKFLVWDEYFKNYLIKYGVKKENIFITGNIANGLLFKMSKNFLYYRELLASKFELDNKKKWIFLPMNYGWAFMDDKAVEFRISRGYDREKAYEHRNFAYKSLVEFIHFLEKLSNLKEYQVILRSHPGVTTEQWKSKIKEVLEKNLDNIYFNKEYSIREWIVASDIIGSNWSTSVLDAQTIGKKVFFHLSFPKPVWLDDCRKNFVPIITNFEDFKEFLKKEPQFINFKNDNCSLENFAKIINILLPKRHPKIYNIEWKYVKNFFKYFIKDKLCKYFNCFKIPKWQHYDYFEAIQD